MGNSGLYSVRREYDGKHGGGYAPAKAVLDVIGKRYLVEAWVSEDGSLWFNRYSDGWIEQGGRSTFPVSSGAQIQLPIAFTTTTYTVNATRSTYTDGNIPFARAGTESYFLAGVKEYGGSRADTCNWVAYGY